MFRRYDNLKRAIALMGVMLTLSCCAQTAHFLCLVAGCAELSDNGAADTGQCHRHANSSTSECHHASECTTAGCLAADPAAYTSVKGHTLDKGHTGDKGHAEDEGGACPCPPSCWCHQTPDPFSMPNGASVPVRPLSPGAAPYLTTPLAVAGCNQPSSPVLASNGSLSANSSGARCAQLCRFLI